MADPTLYLFDGYNLLHAGGFEDVRELRDTLASFVALRGARGVVVLDGHGADETYGPLEGRVESLNVSVAAAVLLYEARRQRRG